MYSISDAALALKNANKSNKQPDAKKIVLAFCPLIEKTTQPHPSGNGTMVTYQEGAQEWMHVPFRQWGTQIEGGLNFKIRQDLLRHRSIFCHALLVMISNTCLMRLLGVAGGLEEAGTFGEVLASVCWSLNAIRILSVFKQKRSGIVRMGGDDCHGELGIMYCRK